MGRDNNAVQPFGGDFVKFMQHLSTDPYLKIDALEKKVMSLIDVNKDDCEKRSKTLSGKMGIGIDGLGLRL